MSTTIEPIQAPSRRLVSVAVILSLSGLSLAAGVWLGYYALLAAVPVLLLALRHWRRANRLRFVPALLHGVGMVAVFLVVPGVMKVQEAARRIDSV